MINIIESKLGQSVKSTELYDYLELTPSYYSRFITKEILNNPYCSDNKDYCTVVQVNNSGGNFRREYYLNIDFAKKICMVSKSKKGNIIRDELVKLTIAVESLDLLSHDQVIAVNTLKSFFKYVDNQKTWLKKHIDNFTSKSNANNPFTEFHNWRNSMLKLETKELDRQIQQYCIDNMKRMPKNQTKDEKIRFLNEYGTLKNAVWDFLSIRGEVNALKLATLAQRMAESENMQVYQKNEDNLFQQKENINIRQLEK